MWVLACVRGVGAGGPAWQQAEPQACCPPHTPPPTATRRRPPLPTANRLHMDAALAAVPELSADDRRRLHNYFLHTCHFLSVAQVGSRCRRQRPAARASSAFSLPPPALPHRLPCRRCGSTCSSRRRRRGAAAAGPPRRQRGRLARDLSPPQCMIAACSMPAYTLAALSMRMSLVLSSPVIATPTLIASESHRGGGGGGGG